MTQRNPFRYFEKSPEITRLAVVMCVRFPPSRPKGFVTKNRDKKAALKFLGTSPRRHGHADEIVTDRLDSCGAVLGEFGIRDRRRSVMSAGEPFSWAHAR